MTSNLKLQLLVVPLRPREHRVSVSALVKSFNRELASPVIAPPVVLIVPPEVEARQVRPTVLPELARKIRLTLRLTMVSILPLLTTPTKFL